VLLRAYRVCKDHASQKRLQSRSAARFSSRGSSRRSVPADITGTYVLTPKTARSRSAPDRFANVLLADRSTARRPRRSPRYSRPCQERQVTFEGDRLRAARSVLRAATAEPGRSGGTYPRRSANRPLFLVRVPMAPERARRGPDATFARHHRAEPFVVLSAPDVLQLQSIAARVHVEDDLI